MKSKKPTLKEKVAVYEEFLHKINLFMTCGQGGVGELLHNADLWSYAHRRGELYTDSEREQLINSAFWKLCHTPKADIRTAATQRRYESFQRDNKVRS